MKKIISLTLSLLIIVSTLSIFSTTAYAGGWVGTAKKINFGTVYNDEFDPKNDFTVVQSNGRPDSYDAFTITVPQKGTVDLSVKCLDWDIDEKPYPFNDDPMYQSTAIYKSTNIDTPYIERGDVDDSKKSCVYSSGGDYTHFKTTFTLPKGTYYIVIVGCNYLSYDIEATYRPSFSNISLSKVVAKDNAFQAKWSKCSNATGYQLQYSLKSSMSSAKTAKITSNSTTSKTVKSLKNKKKYYVRIRTYKTVKVDGKNKTYYGKWSSKKAVTTK